MDVLNKDDYPVDFFPVNSAWVPRWKRVLDVTLALLALPVAVPLAALVAVLIRMVSEGPVLFKQERVGYLGQSFMCFKFRTMFVGADAGAHKGHLNRLIESNTPMTKMDSEGDPRIIPLGRLLRSSGLDELPQLINVFRGEMSLVGPRPCMRYEYEKFSPWQRERFTTLPGLTGLWQVSGKNRTTFIEMMRLDIRYARSKSLWQDLAILSRTIPALVIQLWETRRRGKPVRKSIRMEAVPSKPRTLQSYSLREAAIAEVVRAERRGHVNDEGLKQKL